MQYAWKYNVLLITMSFLLITINYNVILINYNVISFEQLDQDDMIRLGWS